MSFNELIYRRLVPGVFILTVVSGLATPSLNAQEHIRTRIKGLGVQSHTNRPSLTLSAMGAAIQRGPCGKPIVDMMSGNFETALAGLEKCPEKSTGSGLYLRAECLKQLGRYPESLKSFDAAAAKKSNSFRPSVDFYLHYAAAATEAKNNGTALKALREAERMYENLPADEANNVTLFRGAIKKRIGAVYERAGDYEKALGYYIQAVKIQNNKDTNIMAPVIDNPQEKKNAQDWLENSKKFTAEEHGLPKNKYRQAMNLAILRRYGEAEEILKKLVITNPKEADMFNLRLARLYVVQKRYRDACVSYRKWFTYDPMQDHLKTYQGITLSDLSELGVKDAQRKI